MKMDVFASALSAYGPQLTIGCRESASFKSVKIFSDQDRFFNPEILYAGRISDLGRLDFLPQGINFLCIEDEPNRRVTLENAHLNFITVPPVHDLCIMVNLAQDALKDSLREASCWEKLLSAVTHRESAQKMVDIAAELLGNPVIFSDSSTKLIARSNFDQGDSLLWSEHSQYGYFSYETMQSEKYKRMLQKMDNIVRPVLLEKEMSDYDSITGKVLVDNILIGRISVLNAIQPFRNDDIDIVDRLCHILAYHLRQDNFYKFVKDARRESFLRDLIDNCYSDKEEIDQRKMSVGLKLDGLYCVLVVEMRDWDNPNTLQNIRFEIKAFLPPGNSLIYNNKIVYLLNKELLFSPYYDQGPLMKYLTENKLSIGISRNLKDLKNLPELYRQSVDALKIGAYLNSNELIYDYDEYALYHLFHSLSTKVNIGGFCHPALVKLMEYDRRNKSNFTKTLYAYLKQNGNQSATAAELYIHRTSLIYRINKIEEIMDLPLDDALIRSHLYTSFQIIEILERKAF
ncbi:PucR family transcriptional regulator [Desulfitobacterium chlororespirans]|uniref:PucR C-terminal helix-turn-helix domain-containing protein n=1 Tax=Desulfitobacterium chlororespirans DSM 11544 TaxID=1121395 RepID=A0A1M7SG76_9FIRM|nr:helix-turn-helix domain-containing protein [Desulfitobacterium chlororespirans]SHN57481.1 PucR C-terminal helix-turn-helix domain-containing protein [Desulfitobacterium chlororespirans DSM 11544]